MSRRSGGPTVRESKPRPYPTSPGEVGRALLQQCHFPVVRCRRLLRITTDLRAVLKGLLADHLQIASASLNAQVFPGSEALPAIRLLA